MLDQATVNRPLVLPPPYTAVRAETGDAMAEACRRAPIDRAGCLVWRHVSPHGQAAKLDFAVVLEPEIPLAGARRAFIVGMTALGEALGAHCPPERDVRFRWPGVAVLDAGRIGGMRLAVAPDTGESDVPDWMVLGVELIAGRDHLRHPGEDPCSLSLKEAGFADPLAVIESFASYLMLNFDRWNHQGFGDVAARYQGRLSAPGTIAESGDLERGGITHGLAEALARTDGRDQDGPFL